MSDTFDNRQVPQADWTRSLNIMGRALGMNSLIRLEAEILLAAAVERVGLSDFGDPCFLEPLSVLLHSLEEEAELTFTGRLLAAADVLRILESRLRIIDTEKRHPEIAAESIDSPIFVLGMGRTGTTILHELLAQDPANRAPLLWEMVNPAPPIQPGSDPGEKLEFADAFISLFDEIDSSYVAKHEGGGALTNECSYMMVHEVYGTTFFGSHHIPSYMMWMADADPTPAYTMHKRILQMLQWRHETRRWVLKEPNHISLMPVLLKLYPDAKIVHTHRDPAKVVHSTSSLMASLRLMRSDHFDAKGLAEMMNAGQAHNLEKLIGERESGLIPETQIADVFFEDLLSDPIAEVEKLYAHWGLGFTPGARNAMQVYLAERPRTKHGKHEYAYADALDVEQERRRFQRYIEHYGIARE